MTNPREGLTEENARKALHILKVPSLEHHEDSNQLPASLTQKMSESSFGASGSAAAASRASIRASLMEQSIFPGQLRASTAGGNSTCSLPPVTQYSSKKGHIVTYPATPTIPVHSSKYAEIVRRENFARTPPPGYGTVSRGHKDRFQIMYQSVPNK